MSENIISVNIYGTRNEIDSISCSRESDCSLFQRGKCLLARDMLHYQCPYGSVKTVTPRTTKKSSKGEKLDEVRKDPRYARLARILSERAAVIGDYIWLRMRSVYAFKPNDPQKYKESPPNWWTYSDKFGYVFATSSRFLDTFIPLADATPALLNELLSRAAETDKSYVITDLRIYCSDIYAALIKEFPDWKNIESNYTGRLAFLYTLAEGCTISDSHGNKAVFRNGKLYCDEYRSGLAPFGGNVIRNMEIEISKTQIYSITDNSQVCPTTKFL